MFKVGTSPYFLVSLMGTCSNILDWNLDALSTNENTFRLRQCFFSLREKVQVFSEIFGSECAWKPILCVKFYYESMRETQFFAWKLLQKIHAWNLIRYTWKKVKNSLRESKKPCVKKIEKSFSNFSSSPYYCLVANTRS